MSAWTPELEYDLNSKKIILGGCCLSNNDQFYHNNGIFYPTGQEELQTIYFEFEIGGFFGGYPRIEVERTSDAITAKYYPPSAGSEEAICIELSADEFMTYIHKVYSKYLLEWKEEYVFPGVLDGTQ